MSKTNNRLRCGICSKSKTKSSGYYKSNRPEYKDYDGYCPVCKICLRNLSVDENLGKVTPDTLKLALKHLDSPYIESVFVSVMNNDDTTNSNFLGNYRSALNLNHEYKNSTYADSVRFEIREQEIKNSKVEKKLMPTIEIDDEIKMFWGLGQEDEAYVFLQRMFNKFTAHEKNMDYKKESDYKTLCVYEWQKSKIQYDIDEVDKLTKLQGLIDKLSTSLGIQAIQKQEEEDNEMFTLGLITRYHEDIKKKPIRRWVEDLGNVDLMRAMLEVHYKGGILNSLKIPNPDIEKYKAEIDKYTVHITTQDKENDGDDGV